MPSLFDKIKRKAEDIAQGVWRQANPFDGGKTYSNPTGAPRPQQQAPQQTYNQQNQQQNQQQAPQQTYSQPQYRNPFAVNQTPKFSKPFSPPALTQPKPVNLTQPSYGSGIGGLINRAKDTFDANTPQDQFKRQQIGQPQIANTVQDSFRNTVNTGVNQIKNTVATAGNIGVATAKNAVNIPKGMGNYLANDPSSPIRGTKDALLGGGTLGVMTKVVSNTPSLAKPTQGIRDVFDANTARDFEKRNQAEMQKATEAKLNGKMYEPKLNQTYMQQQTSAGRRGRNNFGDAMVGGFAENLNTLGARLYETPETLRGTVAGLTNNQDALKASNERQAKNTQKLYGSNKGGLLNTGTIYDNVDQAKSMGAWDTTKRVVGGQLEGASMVVGGGTLPNIAKSGLKGLASYGGKTFASGAMGNTGNELSTNPNAGLNDVLLQGLIGGGAGLGLGLAGDVVVAGGRKAIQHAPGAINATGRAITNVADKTEAGFAKGFDAIGAKGQAGYINPFSKGGLNPQGITPDGMGMPVPKVDTPNIRSESIVPYNGGKAVNIDEHITDTTPTDMSSYAHVKKSVLDKFGGKDITVSNYQEPATVNGKAAGKLSRKSYSGQTPEHIQLGQNASMYIDELGLTVKNLREDPVNVKSSQPNAPKYTRGDATIISRGQPHDVTLVLKKPVNGQTRIYDVIPKTDGANLSSLGSEATPNVIKANPTNTIPNNTPVVNVVPPVQKPITASKLKNDELYSSTNSDVSFGESGGRKTVSYKPDGADGVPKDISYDKLSPKTRKELIDAENEYAVARSNSTGPSDSSVITPVVRAKDRLRQAQSNAIDELGLQDYATIETLSRNANGTTTIVRKNKNSMYEDWLKQKYDEETDPIAQLILSRDMTANPQKYKAQFEAEQSAPIEKTPAPTPNGIPPVQKPASPFDSLIKQGYKVTDSGDVISPQGKMLTIGEVQNLTQPAYLTDFEHALNRGDKAGMQAIADAHPEDTRVSSFIRDSEGIAPVVKPTQSNQLPATQNVGPDGYTASTKTRQQATQEAQSLPKQEPRQINQKANPEKPQPLLSDNLAQTDRTYANNTPEIDTKQYVKDMNKQQKSAGKGTVTGASKFGDAKEKFIDDLAPIEDRLNKAIKNGAEVDPKDHITYQLDRSRRAEGVMNVYMNDNGLSKVIQNVPNPKEFDQYLIARHAKELDAEIRTGRDPVKDAALVKQLDGKYGGYAKQVYVYNQKLLDSAAEYGLISKQTADALKKKYPEYVPLNRIFKEDELAGLQGNGSGGASVSSQGVVNKLKGSERSIRSPLNSMIDKTRVVIEQGERNKSAQLLASYKDLPDNPFNLKEIDASETIGNRSTIAFLDNGKKRVFEVDKEIADAAKNMNRQELGMWGRIAAVPARVLRAGATGVNAGFAGANVVKDIVGAAINSKHPFRIADPRAMGKALAASLNHNGKYYQELMREGVAGTSFDMYRNALKSNIGEIRSQKNIGRRAAYNISHPSQWYRTVENTIGRSEDFGRALQYYSNKSGFEPKYGKNSDAAKILAADQARNNSTNFFRHGSYGKNLNLAIPYWNAGVQGTRITLRRIKERPVRTVAKIGLVIAAPSAMIAVNNYKDENKRNIMAQIEEYEKDGNIIIVGDDAKFNEQTGRWDGITKIPVPPQHLGIHKTIQNAIKSKFTGEKFNPVDNLGTLIENFTTIDPTDARQLANKYVPQGIKLIAEPMTNTNFFTGNKIVPESQKNLPAQDQYGDFTSGIAKVAGGLTNTSPRMIDNTIRSGMGGAGQNAVRAVDSVLAKAGVIDKDEVQGSSIKDSITNRFVGAKGKSTSGKIDKSFAQLSKEITSTNEYKNASQYDKQRMLNRLQSDISEVAYFGDNKGKAGPDGKEQKLSTKQKQLLGGFDSANYTDLTGGNSLPKDLNGSAKKTITESDGLSADEKTKWNAKQNTDPAIKEDIKRMNNGEDVPVNNETAKLWAEYEKDRVTGKLSPLDVNKRKKEVLKTAYSSGLNDFEKKYYSAADNEIIGALQRGDISKESLKKAMDVDSNLLARGLTSASGFGKKVWNELGLAQPKAKGSGGSKTAKAKGSKAKGSKAKTGKVAKAVKQPQTWKSFKAPKLSKVNLKSSAPKLGKLPAFKGSSLKGIKPVKKLSKMKV